MGFWHHLSLEAPYSFSPPQENHPVTVPKKCNFIVKINSVKMAIMHKEATNTLEEEKCGVK
jgi:hypothetical protein